MKPLHTASLLVLLTVVGSRLAMADGDLPDSIQGGTPRWDPEFGWLVTDPYPEQKATLKELELKLGEKAGRIEPCTVDEVFVLQKIQDALQRGEAPQLTLDDLYPPVPENREAYRVGEEFVSEAPRWRTASIEWYDPEAPPGYDRVLQWTSDMFRGSDTVYRSVETRGWDHIWGMTVYDWHVILERPGTEAELGSWQDEDLEQTSRISIDASTDRGLWRATYKPEQVELVITADPALKDWPRTEVRSAEFTLRADGFGWAYEITYADGTIQTGYGEPFDQLGWCWPIVPSYHDDAPQGPIGPDDIDPGVPAPELLPPIPPNYG